MSDALFQLVHVWFSPKFAIRAAGAVGAIESEVRAAVAGADPQLPVAQFKTVDDLRANITREQRYHASLFTAIAGLALLLSVLGLYGLISHSVARRAHELGVRLALGASSGQAIAAAVRPGLLLALGGIGAGAVLSRLAAGFLRHMLWGVRPTDPATFAITAGILLVAAVAASAIPALRILRIDPAKTLRDQ